MPARPDILTVECPLARDGIARLGLDSCEILAVPGEAALLEQLADGVQPMLVVIIDDGLDLPAAFLAATLRDAGFTMPIVAVWAHEPPTAALALPDVIGLHVERPALHWRGAPQSVRRTSLLAPRVLLAEDDEALRQLVAEQLEAIGLRVVAVGSAPALLEAARSAATHAPFDLLITDVRLPGMSGLRAVRTLREEHFAMPVIVVSGYCDEEVLDQAEAVAAHAVYAKPVDLDELVGRASAIAYQ